MTICQFGTVHCVELGRFSNIICGRRTRRWMDFLKVIDKGVRWAINVIASIAAREAHEVVALARKHPPGNVRCQLDRTTCETAHECASNHRE
jgi:hypothetical protein